MNFPLEFFDIGLWLTSTAIILLITAELISPRYGEINLIIDGKKLRWASLITAGLSMLAIVIRIYEMLCMF
ncbi:MAG: hypothetical protein QXN87_05385 [Candidatus Bathyarchaeia archaeon]